MRPSHSQSLPSRASESARIRRDNAEALLDGTPDGPGRLRELYALTEAALANLTLAELLPELLAHVQMFFGVEAVALFLKDADGEHLRLRASRGLSDVGVVRVPMDRGMIARAFSGNGPVVADDASSDDLASPILERRGVRSAMAAALVADGARAGVLQIACTSPRGFTPEDLRLFQILADRVAYAVERASAHDALLAHAEQQTALIGLAQRAIVSKNLQAVFDDATRTIADVLHVELTDLLEEENGALVFRAGVGWSTRAKDEVVGRSDGRAPYAQPMTGQPFTVESLAEAPQLDAPPLLVDNGVVGLASVAVHDVDRTYGTLNAYSRTRRLFDVHELRFLSAIAGILSLALQRFRIGQRFEEERKRLATIIDVLPVGVYAVDASGCIVRTNAAARGLFRQGGIGRSVFEADFAAWYPDGSPIASDDRPIVRTLREGTTINGLEVVVQRTDGERRNVLATTIPLRDGEALAGAISVTIDVTELRRVEREQRLLAEASSALSSSTDLHAFIPRFARTILPQLGDWCVVFVVRRDQVEPIAVARAPKDDALAHALEEKIPVERMRGLGLRAALLRGKTIVHPRVEAPEEIAAELGVEHPEVVRTLGARSYMIVPMKAAEAPIGAIALVFSQTPRRFGPHDVALAEDLARRAAFAVENALLHAERDEDAHTRAEFLAVASHDLRNPLAAVSSMAALIARTKDDAPMSKVRELAERIQRNTARMDTLIRDLLDLESLRQGGLELHLDDHEAGALVVDVVEMLRPVAEQRRQRLEAIDRAGETLVRCDRERILEVLSNLVGNAIKFAPERGRIAVSVEPIDDGVRFVVCDDGPGIDVEHLPHVFDRFWRADRARKGGIGLGLAIAKGIVDAHGGTIRAENAQGGGACFSFDLPTQSAGTGRFSLSSKR